MQFKLKIVFHKIICGLDYVLQFFCFTVLVTRFDGATNLMFVISLVVLVLTVHI